jgi:hypothetical protein
MNDATNLWVAYSESRQSRASLAVDGEVVHGRLPLHGEQEFLAPA